jgi:hypothetical protein
MANQDESHETEPAAAAATTTAPKRRYAIVAAGASRVDPYDAVYGPDPYASQSGTRKEVAFGDNYSHPNSPAAISEITERGKVIENWLLILQCAERHKEAVKKAANQH